MTNLSQKELTALEETLGFEQVLVKKYTTISEQCTDPVIKSRMTQIAGKHQQHYDKLIGYLK